MLRRFGPITIRRDVPRIAGRGRHWPGLALALAGVGFRPLRVIGRGLIVEESAGRGLVGFACLDQVRVVRLVKFA